VTRDRWEQHATTALLVTGAGAGICLAAPTLLANLDDHAGLVLFGLCAGLLVARRCYRRRRKLAEMADQIGKTAQTVGAVDRALAAGWQARTGQAPPLRLLQGGGQRCDEAAAGGVPASRNSR